MRTLSEPWSPGKSMKTLSGVGTARSGRPVELPAARGDRPLMLPACMAKNLLTSSMSSSAYDTTICQHVCTALSVIGTHASWRRTGPELHRYQPAADQSRRSRCVRGLLPRRPVPGSRFMAQQPIHCQFSAHIIRRRTHLQVRQQRGERRRFHDGAQRGGFDRCQRHGGDDQQLGVVRRGRRAGGQTPAGHRGQQLCCTTEHSEILCRLLFESLRTVVC